MTRSFVSPSWARPRRLAVLLSLSLAPLAWLSSTPAMADASVPATQAIVPTAQAGFQVLYPGLYTPREAAVVQQYLAANQALKARGPIDVARLVKGELPKDTPGLGPVIPVTEAWVRYNNAKYDADNPLRNDAAYARKAGFADILAYPTFGAHDDSFMVPYPVAARDKLFVSDLNHSVTSYRPIYPGDTLYLVADEREVIDLTPPQGAIQRSLAINTKGSVYNQRGEKVNDVVFRVTEGIKVFKNPADAPKSPSFFDIWEAPDWLSRPAHFYTDADWQFIRKVMSEEKRRGAEPLYWEDVAVGEHPSWTIDGPIEASVAPVPPWGMGAGGSRSIKRELLDPGLSKGLLRGAKDGIWREAQRVRQVPVVPPSPVPAVEGAPTADAGAIVTTDIHKDGVKRSPLVNYMGRDLAIRHIGNWMGDKGWLQTIRWSIMDPRASEQRGIAVPHNPRAEHFLDKVPSMKGRYVSEHGLTQDVALVKSEVVGKQVRDGAFYADLVWWIETIDGQVWLEGEASVKLPSRRSL
jgi:hypothetical protein